MLEIQATALTRWNEAAPVQASALLRWNEAGPVQSLGGPYVTPAPPPGGASITPGSLAPLREILPATSYRQSTPLSVVDLRTGLALPVESVSLSLPDLSDLWTLQAAGPSALADTMRAGSQPATVEVTIGANKWRFVVEEIDQPLSFASRGVTIRGRSLAAAAGAPYQAAQTWLADAPTSAAQICALANTFTGVEVVWDMPDWLIPAGGWSATLDPLGVVRAMAQAVGATVEAHPTEPRLTVRSRYPIEPAAWAGTAPDLQVPRVAVEALRQEIVDQPPYDGIVVVGEESGQVLFARLAGTSGSVQAPMISDPLLTDSPALLERAAATLHSFGGRNRETRTLQMHGAAEERGALVRWVDPGVTWVGMVRGVEISATLDKARQSLTLERPTSFPTGVAGVAPAPAPLPEPPAPPPPPPAVTGDYLFKFRLNGSAGQTAGIVNDGTFGGTYVLDGLEQSLETAAARFGTTGIRARGFSRNSELVDLSNAAFVNSGSSSAGTIGGWFDPNGATAAATAYYKLAAWTLDDSSPSNYVSIDITLGTGGNYLVLFTLSSSVGGGGLTHSVQVGNDWQHVEVGWVGGAAYIFSNGALVHSGSYAPGAAVGTTGSVRMAAPEWPFGQYVYLDDVFIHTGCLHTASFTPEALTGPPPAPPPPPPPPPPPAPSYLLLDTFSGTGEIATPDNGSAWSLISSEGGTATVGRSGGFAVIAGDLEASPTYETLLTAPQSYLFEIVVRPSSSGPGGQWSFFPADSSSGVRRGWQMAVASYDGLCEIYLWSITSGSFDQTRYVEVSGPSPDVDLTIKVRVTAAAPGGAQTYLLTVNGVDEAPITGTEAVPAASAFRMRAVRYTGTSVQTPRLDYLRIGAL
jgi:hypothetical protein